MRTKSFLRAAVVFILILGLGWLGIWVLGRPGASIEVKIPEAANPTIKGNGDDFSSYGGKTPGEAIKFLITALEKNDLTLAAKYFVPEIREAESEDLNKLNGANLLSDLIGSLKNLNGGKLLNGSHYRYEINDETGQPVAEVDLIKNKAGLWKISAL